MVELPSNVIEADRFIEMMELAGGSIGSNDLVQTVSRIRSREVVGGYQDSGRKVPLCEVNDEILSGKFNDGGWR